MKLGKHVDLEMPVKTILGELKSVDTNAGIENKLKETKSTKTD